MSRLTPSRRSSGFRRNHSGAPAPNPFAELAVNSRDVRSRMPATAEADAKLRLRVYGCGRRCGRVVRFSSYMRRRRGRSTHRHTPRMRRCISHHRMCMRGVLRFVRTRAPRTLWSIRPRRLRSRAIHIRRRPFPSPSSSYSPGNSDTHSHQPHSHQHSSSTEPGYPLIPSRPPD